VIVQSVNEEQIDGQRARIAYVCASPSGRAWRAGEAVSSDPGNPYRVRVVAGAGEWVALRFESVIGEGESVEERAINAATGRSVHYWSAGGGMGTGSGGTIERVLLDSRGRLAFVLGLDAPIKSGSGTEGEGEQLLTREIVGVGTTGKRKVLDSAPHAQIPAQSLMLVGGTVRWTDAGVARSAKL
jgi:hypothetical protein